MISRAYPLHAATHAYVINHAKTPVSVESVKVWGMKSIWSAPAAAAAAHDHRV